MVRKELKKDARKIFSSQYFKTILFVFIAGIIINGGYTYSSYIMNNNIADALIHKTNFQIINEFISNITNFSGGTKGVIGPIINNITSSKSIVLGFLNTLNMFIFDDKIGAAYISLLSLLISTWFYIFVQRVLVIGKIRYFLEARRYTKTEANKLFFPFRVQRGIHLAWILFLKGLYKVLWWLTIVMGPIKHYEYMMLPYVLAENPNINKEQAFRLSKELIDGHKWETFKLDFSMLGWHILGFLTVGISNLFYFDSYKESIYVELYMRLRKEKMKLLTDKKMLCDKYLDIKEVVNDTYPDDKYFIPYSKIFNFDIKNTKYSITSLILFFFTVSFGGWLWEVMVGLVTMGEVVNRGTMYGPWLPIYGYGGVLIILFLNRFKKNPFKLFIASMILCGTVEYLTSLYLELVNGMRWWDYTDFFLNLNGRVCFEGLLVFGLAGSAGIYFLGPMLNNVFKKIPKNIAIMLCVVLVTFYGIDFVYSTLNPHTGYGITSELKET